MPSTEPRLSPTERVLRLFTDIRPGEGNTALLMFANVFLILCAYYFIKPLREGWIAVSGVAGLEKMEVRAYSSFGQSLLLVGVIAWYSGLVNRLPRARLIALATLFCMSNMVVFWFLQPDFFVANLPLTGIVFYLWVGMFGVFVVAQFWAFAADVYTDEAGRRLMPVVAIGATAGAAFGAQITSFLVEGGVVHLLERLQLTALAELAGRYLRTEALLLLALIPLAVSIWITQRVDRNPAHAPKSAPASRDGRGGLHLVLGSRFLLAVAAITVLLNWVNTNGENMLFRVVQEMLAERAAQSGVAEGEAMVAFTRDGTTAFYGTFYTWVNVAALVLQALVASRLLKYGGFGAIMLMLPVVALMSYSAMALVPVLAVVAAGKFAENSTDYSISNTARHVLWLPVPSEVKFKGKPTIDSLFVRIGDGFAALTILLGVHWLALHTQLFFVLNVALVLVWLVLAVAVTRDHKQLAEEATGHAAG